MRLRQEASVGIGSILVLQVLLSALGIVLLNRMGPAIEHILEDNVFSSLAVEEMLSILAEPDVASHPASHQRFEEAFSRARENVTEPEERPLIQRIARGKAGALAGEPDARRDVIAALRQLAQVNHDSMARADRGARRLGTAGAWAAAMLGALALGLGVMVYRRLRLRLELPVEILRQTLERIRNGDARARCVVGPGPTELRQIARDLNAILDRGAGEPATPSADAERRDATELRRLLGWALDREAAPTLVIDAKGRVVAMNQAMRDRQDAEDAPPAVDAEGAVTEGWVVSELDGTTLRVVQPAG
ncbi:MAG: hypothetical protein R3B40_08585 [Polyangiales bacterium]|nr:hypothetical protein [Myxococcales bacterium]MCB9656336.1 hypothetical protein [Sandaracinaceae bacterium]